MENIAYQLLGVLGSIGSTIILIVNFWFGFVEKQNKKKIDKLETEIKLLELNKKKKLLQEEAEELEEKEKYKETQTEL